MKRVLVAGLLALPAIFATSGTANAQVFGCSQYGCGGFCFKMFPHIHQHGPLYNYGPYSGYYPFEPYGPWTADLRYNGPTGPDCGRHGCGLGGRLRGLGNGLGCHSCGSDSCDGGCGKHAWGNYALSTFGNIFHRCHPLAHKCGHKFGCADLCGSSCGTPACDKAAPCATPAPAGCAAKPADVESSPVLQTGYPRRER